MNYELGEKALVVRNFSGHNFKIGSVVILLENAKFSEFFYASDGKVRNHIFKKEVIPYCKK